jgi:hypothetical protein
MAMSIPKWVPFDENGELFDRFNVRDGALDDQTLRDELAAGTSRTWGGRLAFVKPNWTFDATLTYKESHRDYPRLIYLDDLNRQMPIMFEHFGKILADGRVTGNKITGKWTFKSTYGYWGVVLVK